MAQIILDSNSNLIQGDFDTATLSQRTRLQTSTVNATTGVYVVPNGSATSASVQVSNAADPTNASKVVVATNGSTDTQIVSGANGSGTYLPLSFYTNNDIRFQMGTAGELNVRTAPGTVSSGSSGQFLTSGGPGAGVSWTTVTVPPSGQVQTELFTSPGTWTKPSTVTQVRVTVIGAGGGGSGPGIPAGSPGGTSSFGPAVSATGGAGSPGAGAGGNGSGTVSVGTALKTYDVSLGIPGTTPIATSNVFLGVISGSSIRPAQPGAPKASTAYTTSSTFIAGAKGLGQPSNECGGAGGYAIAIAPVSAPVTVTVGTGGSGGGPTGPGISGGVNGAVLVEWVG